MRSIHIGILGLGNVGSGALQILQERQAILAKRVGAHLRVKRILVRDLERPRDVAVREDMLCTDAAEIVEDPNIEVVVELIGGLEPARSHVLAAIRNGKHVVTANKALMAEHGDEIFDLAARHRVSVYFEGSVAGGIPIVRALREGLASDQIDSICGIINGTSNFILDSMSREGCGYEDALAQAQAAGYAEADPTLDVSGGDAAHKLALLALVCFGVRVDAAKIPIEGIESLTKVDMEAAKELGYVIKSLAIADRGEQERPCLRVHPTLVPREHILAGVSGSFNAVLVHSRALGSSMYYGRGAGMMPTGVAVVSDIIEVCRDLAASVDANYSGEHASSKGVHAVNMTPIDALCCENYLRFFVQNRPGVLGQLASTLGRYEVSIKSMSQDSPDEGVHMNVRIITEAVAEIQVAQALDELGTSEAVIGPVSRLRMLNIGDDR